MGKFAEEAYYRMPWWIQNLIVSSLGYRLHRRRYGKIWKQYCSHLGDTVDYDETQIKELQEQSFDKLVRHALAHVPYYRRWAEGRGLTGGDSITLDEISSLPVVGKDMVRRSPAEFVAEPGSFVGNVITLGTSGTTGTPLSIQCDAPCREKHFAFWTRLRKTFDIEPGDWRATFFGRIIMQPDAQSPPYWRHDRPQKNVLYSSYHMQEENLIAYYNHLKAFDPPEIIGYPSSLSILAHFMVRNDLPRLGPKVVFTTAETLLAGQRAVLEKAFKAPIIDQYGCTEMVLFVAQCREGKYHIHPEHGFMEILDENDQPVPPGTEGEAVCTGFLNYGMPLIRYRLGDRVTAGKDICPCGSAFPVLERIEGRVDAILYTPEGRPIPRLDPVFKSLSGIRQTQIIQEKANLIVLKIVIDDDHGHFDQDQLIRELKKKPATPSIFF